MILFKEKWLTLKKYFRKEICIEIIIEFILNYFNNKFDLKYFFINIFF